MLNFKNVKESKEKNRIKKSARKKEVLSLTRMNYQQKIFKPNCSKYIAKRLLRISRIFRRKYA